MTSAPVAVMDAQDLAQETPALQHRLDWLRSEGIDPDTTRRVEVYLEEGGLYAEVTSFGHDDRAHTATAVSGEPVVSKRRQGVSSVPPTEAAANTLDARVTGKP